MPRSVTYPEQGGTVEDDTTTEPAGGPGEPTSADPAPELVRYGIEVIAIHPHDPDAYTQGLEFLGGSLLESTGLRGESTIRLVDPTTGEVTSAQPLDDEFFGEGVTAVDDELLQLTWQAETLIVRRAEDLSEIRRVGYRGEGWGLCDDGDRLVMSNGSSELTFRDRSTFDPIDTVTVRLLGEPVEQLNELECVGGLVWANVFQQNRILAIDPSSGTVVGTVDVTDLVPEQFVDDSTNVVNGIAVDPATGRFWLTGKRWPVMYEVELAPIG